MSQIDPVLFLSAAAVPSFLGPIVLWSAHEMRNNFGRRSRVSRAIYSAAETRGYTVGAFSSDPLC